MSILSLFARRVEPVTVRSHSGERTTLYVREMSSSTFEKYNKLRGNMSGVLVDSDDGDDSSVSEMSMPISMRTNGMNFVVANTLVSDNTGERLEFKGRNMEKEAGKLPAYVARAIFEKAIELSEEPTTDDKERFPDE